MPRLLKMRSTLLGGAVPGRAVENTSGETLLKLHHMLAGHGWRKPKALGSGREALELGDRAKFGGWPVNPPIINFDERLHLQKVR